MQRTRRIGAAVITSLALLATGSPTQADPRPSAIDPIPEVLPALPSYVDASGVTFVGPIPGAAGVSVSGETVTLDNAALKLALDVSGVPQVRSFTNKVTGKAENVTQGRLLFSSGGTVDLGALTWTRTAAPTVSDLAPDPTSARLAEQKPGKRVTVTYTATNGTFSADVVWTAELRQDANYVRQGAEFTVTAGSVAPSGSAAMQIGLLELTLPGARTTAPVDGSPVAVGPRHKETLFASLEHPMAKLAMGADNVVRQSLPTRRTYGVGATFGGTTTLGVSAPGQLRRSVGYYVARERVHERRTFLHYQSWYDLKPNPPGTPNPLMVNAKDLNASMKVVGDALNSRDAKLDSFWIDDGWDYLRDPQVPQDAQLPVWSFDPTQYPDGFAPQKAIADGYDASMSVWMSPFGGYGASASRRAQINAAKPVDQRLERNNAGFALGGQKYGAHFRDVVFDMIDNNGVRGFKFDGIGGGLNQTGPNATFLADYEAMFDLLDDMRDHEEDIWVNATVGTWGSPYWLWYVDSIWRDGNDAVKEGTAGWNAVDGDATDRYISYRDGESMRYQSFRNTLFPTANLMNHGLIFSPMGYTEHFNLDTDVSKPAVIDSVRRAAKSYFGLGLGLQELYIRVADVAPSKGAGAVEFWDIIAENAKWARANEELFTDSRMIGADPTVGVYGNVSWWGRDNGAGVLMLRNPTAETRTFTVDPKALFELPDGQATRYTFTERDGAADAFTADMHRPYTFELAPSEVLIFEAKSSDDPITPSPAEAPAPDGRLDGSGWNATANTQEVAGENGRATNVLDNNPATIWHSRYGGGTDPVPHTLTIDMLEPTTFERIDYVPRMTGVNGNLGEYRWEVSDNGTDYRTVNAGTWASDATTKTVTLATPVTARYLRLVAPVGGYKVGSALNAITSAGDINVFAAVPGEEAPTAPPSTIAPITDATFNHLLNGNDLTVRSGGTLTIPDALAGWSFVSVSDAGGTRADLGWSAPKAGTVSADVVVPASVLPGEYRLELRSLDGRPVGWAPLLVLDATAPAVDPIADVSVRVGDQVSVQVKATDEQTPLTYTATGLPAGITIDRATGLISGRPTAEGRSTVRVSVTDAHDNATEVTFAITVTAKAPSPSPTPTATPTVTPPKPSPTPSTKPTVTPPKPTWQPSAPYTLPGHHLVNGRSWFTECERYSQTRRCRTDIWASTVVKEGGRYVVKQGWTFNNLTYLPYLTRAAWAGNPLGHTTRWTAKDGRTWYTECDTPATGRGACRSYVWATVVSAKAKRGGGYTFAQYDTWVFNNIVLFRQ